MSKPKRVNKTFVAWLNRNRDRFIAEPVVIEIRKGHMCLSFVGIRPEITAIIQYRKTYRCISVFVDYRGRCWDILADFDVQPQRLSSGEHVCKLCLPGHKHFFRSRHELLSDHLFDPLLKWVNVHLTPSSWICFFATASGGATWAKIIEADQINMDPDFEQLVDAFPVHASLAHGKPRVDG